MCYSFFSSLSYISSYNSLYFAPIIYTVTITISVSSGFVRLLWGKKIIAACCAIVSVQEKVTEERVQRLKQRFMSAYDVTADGKLQIQEVFKRTVSHSCDHYFFHTKEVEEILISFFLY